MPAYNARLMHKDSLPLKVDPFRFAENALSLHGIMQVKEMERLSESLESPEGDIEVDLVFGLDEQGIAFLKGSLKTALLLQCQRCMRAYEYVIMSDFLFGIVKSEEQAETLPERYDPVVVKDGALFLRDVIEEELIVSLPIVPMHPVEQCEVKLPLAAASPQSEEENPFKVIELLRSKRNVKE